MIKGTHLLALLLVGLSLAPLGSAHGATAIPQGIDTPVWVRFRGGALIGSDANAAYWSAYLTADPRVIWAISGIYPSARYTSIQAYTAIGASLTGLADKDFPPDRGSVNPFVAGTQRGIGSYTLHVVFGPAPSPPVPGTLYANVPSGSAVRLLYRVYLPDKGATASGNVPLPAFNMQHGAAASAASGSDGPATRVGASFTAAGPATVRPAWPYVRVGSGRGWFINMDEAYLFGLLPLATTVLYVLRFEAPTTPATLAGEPFNPNTQLRYWSVCVYSIDYLPYKCLADEQVPHGARGQVIIVMGAPWARPSNATADNGVAWLGLGAGSRTYGLLIRNLLPAATFDMSAFAVPFGAMPGPYMGPYAPAPVTCTTADFEQNECVMPSDSAAVT